VSLDAFYRANGSPRDEGLLARYSDLVLAVGVIAIVALMVVALPPPVIDLLVVINLLCGVGLLLLAIYIGRPTEFTAFPSVLLISTLFRLALGVATTRMILLDGDAGQVIDTFGKTVAGGNLVVGLVTFLIITVVQFIVIAKGAERVAEVAARFSLDAMPGKQLSIDSDLRSGLIDKTEARRRRSELELESTLHGNLDGAMKFVKGDAIAGIVIILINLVGGLAVGVLQKGMDLSHAMLKYSILTIGDGLATQIPALLGAMSAALIVTRTQADESDRHLGDSIRKQVLAKPRALLITGGLCALLALVPGFPTLLFLLLGGTVAAVGASLTPGLRERLLDAARPIRARLPEQPSGEMVLASSEPMVVQPMEALLLELYGPAARGVSPHELAARFEQVRQRFQLGLGVVLPRVALHFDPDQPRSAWRLLAFEVPIAQGEPDTLGADPIVEASLQALRRHAALFVGTQEVAALMTRATDAWPDLVRDAQRTVSLSRLAEVFRRLVEEEVGVRNLRALLEAFADTEDRETDVHALTEFARIALRRQLSHRFAPAGRLRALVLSPDIEGHLRQAVRTVGNSQQLSLDPPFAAELVASVGAAVAQSGVPLVLTSIEVRRHLRKLIEVEHFDVAVLSFHELVPTLQLDVAGQIDVRPGGPARIPGSEQ
jgi:type III secretion protein V